MFSMQLKSSNLKSATYDAESKALTVHFRNGNAYRYENVPPKVFQELGLAPSAGKYFHANIRSAYPAVNMNEEFDSGGNFSGQG